VMAAHVGPLEGLFAGILDARTHVAAAPPAAPVAHASEQLVHGNRLRPEPQYVPIPRHPDLSAPRWLQPLRSALKEGCA
jgi:hypothetical protein